MAARLAALTLTICAMLPPSTANAVDVPQSFTLDGQLFSDAAGTTPLADPLIPFKVQVLDHDQICVLYEELQNINTATSSGYFSVQVGSAIGSPRRTVDDSGNSMATVFQNIAAVNGKLLSNGNACAATPTAGNRRFVRITIAPNSMGGAERVLAPNLTVDSVPNAIVAERAESIQGFRSDDLLKVNTTAGSALSQANLESLFTSVTRFNALSAVVDGTSTNYVQSTTSGARLPVITGAPPSPAQGSIWYDTGDNLLKYYDGTTPISLGVGSGTVTSVSGTLPISVANGTTAAVVSIATANTTTTGALSSADWNIFNAKLTSPLTTKGDLLSRDGATHVRLPVGSDGQVLVPDAAEASGLRWTNFSVGNLKTAAGAAQFGDASCAATQTLTWSSLTNAFSCTAIAGLNASVITAGTIADARLPAGATYWTAATGGINRASGNVGIGSANPGALLQIGTEAASLGTMRLAGNTSGYVQIQPAAAAGSWTMTLPVNDGDAGQALMTDGSGVTTWTTVPVNGGTFLAGNGTNAAPSISFSGDTGNNTGFYLSAENEIGVAVNGVAWGRFQNDQFNVSRKIWTGNCDVSDPCFSFAADQNSGIYSISDNVLGFATNGAERVRIDGSGNFGIRTTNPGAMLQVGEAGTSLGTMRLTGNTSGYVQLQTAAAAGSWTMTLPANDGDNGQVLTTNGSGVTSWVSAGAATTIDGLTDAVANYATNYNMYLGSAVGGTTTTGFQNTALGSLALQNITESEGTVAIGNQALQYLTTGNNNVGIGREVMHQTSTGSTNIAIGQYALGSNTSGSENVAIGGGAIAFATASENTAIGSGSLGGGITSGANVAVGRGAGSNITGASYGNIFLGYLAGPDSSTTISDTLWIANYNGTPTIYGNLSTQSVSIGTTTTSDKLHVFGDIRVGTTGTNGCLKDFAGGTITGTCSSDERLKKDFRPMDSVSDKLSQIQPYFYKWRSEEFPDRHYGKDEQLGVIAQDIKRIFPNLVVIDEDGYFQVKYSDFTMYLLKGFSEQHERVQNVERGIASIEKNQSQLKLQVEQLRNENAQLKAYLCAKDPGAPICK